MPKQKQIQTFFQMDQTLNNLSYMPNMLIQKISNHNQNQLTSNSYNIFIHDTVKLSHYITNKGFY